jgi:hypothetical protein
MNANRALEDDDGGRHGERADEVNIVAVEDQSLKPHG